VEVEVLALIALDAIWLFRKGSFLFVRSVIKLPWPEKAALDYFYLERQNVIEDFLPEWN
jgi:hypothetical protein